MVGEWRPGQPNSVMERARMNMAKYSVIREPFKTEYTSSDPYSVINQDLFDVNENTSKKNKGGSWNALNNIGNFGAIGGDIISGFGSAIGNQYGDDFSEDQKASQSSIRSLLAMIPGYGQIIAAATGAVDAIGTATGLNLSNVNQKSADRAGVGTAAKANGLINRLPGVSMLASGFGLWSDRTQGYKMSDEAKEMQAGYSGTVGDLRAAEDLANKRLFGGKNWGAAGKANDFIDDAIRNTGILTQINRTNTMRKESDYYQDLQHQNINRYAGQNYHGITVGRKGTKLISMSEAKAIIMAKHGSQEDLQKLQNGGIIGIDTNILPEGALHARKNNLAEINPDLEEVTKKGIPVMAAEGGEIGEQVAEIEHSEIIFRLDVTKRLEELRKDGSEEAMIEAGKLIAEELIENTQDNVGMITEEVENG